MLNSKALLLASGELPPAPGYSKYVLTPGYNYSYGEDGITRYYGYSENSSGDFGELVPNNPSYEIKYTEYPNGRSLSILNSGKVRDLYFNGVRYRHGNSASSPLIDALKKTGVPIEVWLLDE